MKCMMLIANVEVDDAASLAPVVEALARALQPSASSSVGTLRVNVPLPAIADVNGHAVPALLAPSPEPRAKSTRTAPVKGKPGRKPKAATESTGDVVVRGAGNKIERAVREAVADGSEVTAAPLAEACGVTACRIGQVFRKLMAEGELEQVSRGVYRAAQ